MKPRIEKEKKAKISAIDLFCGAGGLTRGLENVGIDVLLGIDINQTCEFSYKSNTQAKFLLKPIEEVGVHELLTVFPKDSHSLLAGCAPCQTFSKYNPKAKKSDKRWSLLTHFSRLVQEVCPELVTIENVPGLINQNVFKKFVRDLKKASYQVYYQILNCADYGVPQSRQRLVLLASKLGPINFTNSLKQKEKLVTVRDAIGDCPSLQAGEIDPNDPMHQCAALSEINLQRIKASRAGGTWRDWDKKLRANCHKKKTGKTYPSVYGRMCWDEPGPTMTTQFYGFGNGRFGHPEQNRAISLREGAILQSFPHDYVFVPPGEIISKTAVGKLIGNAVPVKLAEVIGKILLEHVSSTKT